MVYLKIAYAFLAEESMQYWVDKAKLHIYLR